ncbi:hypothetical protein [Mycolicibacterium sp.]|uniref:hypothetical protein n=1 Tax=Mycolicibacterium sp. TaxID=2320850 RepID=UPI00355DA7A3
MVFDQAVRLVETYGPDEVIETVGRLSPVDRGHIKGLLHDLGIELAAGPIDPDQIPGQISHPAWSDPAELQRRRDTLAQLVATYLAEGEDIPEDLLAELAACDNEPNPGGS